jgi:hypothetical protein
MVRLGGRAACAARCGVVALGILVALGRPAGARPAVWAMVPANNDGAGFRALFDQPDQWVQARARIDTLGYADHWLATQFNDAELRRYFAQVAAWHLKLGLEIGAIKVWGKTADRSFMLGRKNWDRFIADGAQISAFAMDEPLRVTLRVLHESPQYAVEETAKFVAMVRRTYPWIQIGDIEGFPGASDDELLPFIDALQARLRAMGVRGLDFFRLDVDWMWFRTRTARGAVGWAGVRHMEEACHRRGLPFSLIYWAADYPSLERQGLATDETWEQGIMYEGRAYQDVGGVPDQYVIQSWVNAPAQTLPDDQPGTFMRSVLDFTATFVK